MSGHSNDSFLLSRNRCKLYQPTQVLTTSGGSTGSGNCQCPPGEVNT